MLGVDAVDSMLFGGNSEGREATFNVPGKVNLRYRPYDRDFSPKTLSLQARVALVSALPNARTRARSRRSYARLPCSGGPQP
jgi:hypothetical protein